MPEIYSVRIIAANLQFPQRAVNVMHMWVAPLDAIDFEQLEFRQHLLQIGGRVGPVAHPFDIRAEIVMCHIGIADRRGPNRRCRLRLSFPGCHGLPLVTISAQETHKGAIRNKLVTIASTRGCNRDDNQVRPPQPTRQFPNPPPPV